LQSILQSHHSKEQQLDPEKHSFIPYTLYSIQNKLIYVLSTIFTQLCTGSMMRTWAIIWSCTGLWVYKLKLTGTVTMVCQGQRI